MAKYEFRAANDSSRVRNRNSKLAIRNSLERETGFEPATFTLEG